MIFFNSDNMKRNAMIWVDFIVIFDHIIQDICMHVEKEMHVHM